MGVQAEGYDSAVWRKSKHSGNSANCVEIALSDTSVLVRDSHDRSGPVLALSAPRWRELMRRIRGAD